MATLSEIFIKKEKLEIILNTLNQKQGEEAKGIKITITQDDKSNQYGQNVTAYVAQTKEQRDAKVQRFYIGNGKVFWSKGETPVGSKPAEATSQTYQNNTRPSTTGEPEDLPF